MTRGIPDVIMGIVKRNVSVVISMRSITVSITMTVTMRCVVVGITVSTISVGVTMRRIGMRNIDVRRSASSITVSNVTVGISSKGSSLVHPEEPNVVNPNGTRSRETKDVSRDSHMKPIHPSSSLVNVSELRPVDVDRPRRCLTSTKVSQELSGTSPLATVLINVVEIVAVNPNRARSLSHYAGTNLLVPTGMMRPVGAITPMSPRTIRPAIVAAAFRT